MENNIYNEQSRSLPELRFPEFDGNWIEKKLGEVFVNSRKKGDNTLPIYSVSQVFGLIPRDSLDRSIQKDADSELNLAVDQNDLVYNMMRMWQGAIGIAKTNCMVSPAYIVLKPKEKEFAQFYSYLFSKKRSLYLFWAYSYGLTNDRLRLYFKDFISIKRHVPKLTEQIKIATFLSAVDKRINLLQKKKVELEQYKKGVMQKIFSQEIRFKDDNGQKFPKWDKKRLGDVYSFKVTNSYSRENLNYDHGSVKNIHYGDIHTRFATLFDVINEYVPFINSAVELRKISDDCYLREGDLIFADASEDYNDIGKCIEIVNLNNEYVLAGLHTLLARPKDSFMSIGFGGYLMKSN